LPKKIKYLTQKAKNGPYADLREKLWIGPLLEYLLSRERNIGIKDQYHLLTKFLSLRAKVLFLRAKAPTTNVYT